MKERITLYCLLSVPVIGWVAAMFCKTSTTPMLLYIALFLITLMFYAIAFFTLWNQSKGTDESIKELKGKVENLEKSCKDNKAQEHEKEMTILRAVCKDEELIKRSLEDVLKKMGNR